MVITKLGHCCLLIEIDGINLLTDPGAWTELPEDIGGIQAVLITHEHTDHFHVPSLQKVLAANPKAPVYANQAVGALLQQENIAYVPFEHGQKEQLSGVEIAGFGQEHASIYSSIPKVVNTGFMVAGRFFYPGDAFFVPGVPVEILALPVVGPWMKMSEALDYAQEVRPKIALAVHDGMLAIPGPFHAVPQAILPKLGIDFRPLLVGQTVAVP